MRHGGVSGNLNHQRMKSMRIIAINGSPRKKWNTATLLQHALEGASERAIIDGNAPETEIVHLYEHEYKGCISCFACKKIGGKSYGRCAVSDGLTGILERVAEADVLLMGSPVYFHCETGEMRSFMERLLFPYITYTPGYKSIFPRTLPTGLVYTMNVPEEALAAFQQDRAVNTTASFVQRILGSAEVLLCTDTLQFDDYSKYLSTCWDPVAKAKRREVVFPQDCARARQLGARLAEQAMAQRQAGTGQ